MPPLTPSPLSPLRSLAPRPLPLHLEQALTLWSNAGLLWPLLKNASPILKKSFPAPLQKLLQEIDPQKFQDQDLALALNNLGHQRLAEFLAGIKKYRHAGFKRETPTPPILREEGTTKLLDYSKNADEKAITLLAIPSLINRYYVMDLSEDRSFLRYLGNQGLRTYVIDWDCPGPKEQTFSLEDYILRLERLFQFLRERNKGPLFVLGYCMGGLLALALALRQQKNLTGWLALATPFDFHIDQEALVQRLTLYGKTLSPWFERWEEMPVDILQTSFASTDPISILNKFRAFSRMEEDSDEARQFIALEDWLNDGVPLAKRVAQECLADWYGANKPVQKAWKITGEIIDPAKIKKPSFFAIPSADRIVPPASARALADHIAGAEIIEPPAGHIGMMVGSKAKERLWRPLCDWLHKNSAS